MGPKSRFCVAMNIVMRPRGPRPYLLENPFLWDGTKFQAFEQGHGEALRVGNGCLVKLAEYPNTHQLSSRIALSKLDLDLSYKLLMENCELGGYVSGLRGG